MKNISNEIMKFRNFLQRRYRAAAFLFIVTLILYLPVMTNFGYAIDSEQLINDSNGLFSWWLSIDRFGLVALTRLLVYGINLNTYFINALTYLFLAFSAILLLYIIDQTTEKEKWTQTLAVLFYIVSPIHFEQTSFVLQSVGVMFAYNLMFISVIMIGFPGTSVSRQRLILGITLLVASFSVYPSIVIGAALLFVAVLHFHELKTPFSSIRVYFYHVFKYIAILVVSLLSYLLLNLIVKYFAHVPKNNYIQFAWGKQEPLLILKSIASQFLHNFILPSQTFGFYFVTLFGLVAFVLTFVHVVIRRNIPWTILLDIVAEFVLAISLLILVGSWLGPIRSYTPTVPLIITIYVLNIMCLLSNKHVILLIGLCFSVVALAQSKTTSDLEQTSILKYNSEASLANRIVNRVEEKGIFNTSDYKLVVLGTEEFGTPLTRAGDMVGFTHFSYGAKSPTGVSLLAKDFLRSQGSYFANATPSDYQKAQRVGGNMQRFPAKSGLQVVGKMIIVKLQ